MKAVEILKSAKAILEKGWGQDGYAKLGKVFVDVSNDGARCFCTLGGLGRAAVEADRAQGTPCALPLPEYWEERGPEWVKALEALHAEMLPSWVNIFGPSSGPMAGLTGRQPDSIQKKCTQIAELNDNRHMTQKRIIGYFDGAIEKLEGATK